MADNPEPIEVSIVARIQGLLDGLGQATSGVKDATEQMQNSFNGLAQMVNNLKAPFLAITGILAGGAMFKKAIDETISWTMEANKLHKVLGLSIEDASGWAVDLHTLGISGEQMEGIAGRLTMRVHSNAAAFQKWGIETKNAEGGPRKISEIIMSMADKYQGLSSEQQKNAMLVDLAGRNWMAYLAIMRLTAERIADAKKEAKELGLEVGPDGVAKGRAYQEAMRKLSLIMLALGNMIGRELIPVLTSVATWMGGNGAHAAQVFSIAIKLIVSAIQTLWFALKTIGNVIAAIVIDLVEGFSAVGKALWKVVHGDFSGAAATMKQAAQDSKDLWHTTGEAIKGDWENLGDSLAKSWDTKPGKPGKDDPDAGALPEKPKSPLQDWEKELEKRKALLAQSDGDLATMSQADEREFWAKKLAMLQKGSADWVTVRLKMASLGQSIDKEEQAAIDKAAAEWKAAQDKAAREALALAKVVKDGKLATAKEELAGEEETLRHGVAMGTITAKQKLAAEKGFLEKKKALDIQALADDQANYEKGSHEWQALEDKKLQAEKKFLGDSKKLEDQALEERKSNYSNLFHAMTGGFSSAIGGLIKGTMSWGQALKSVLSSALDGIINFFVQWGLKQVETYLMGLIFGETTRKTEATGAASVYAINAMASVAAIPGIGWAMAPGVGAEAFAEGMAFVPSAAGGWDSVAGNPLTQLHEKEMVLSAPLAEGLRGIIANGQGGAGQTIHNHISAMDAKSFKQALHENRGGLFDVMKGGARDRRF